MFRSLLSSIVLLTALGGAAQAQAPERRQALVIGNAEYRGLGRLATPVADARLVADTLRRSGFEVTEQDNVDDRSIRRVLRDFTERVDAGGPGGVAVVYLAGYALFSESANFFLPVNAQLRRPEDVGVQGLSVDDVLAAVSATSAQLRVVLVDAARVPATLDRQQFGAGGLAGVLVPEQTVVGLAAQPGAIAPEGDRNSPFATALARYVGAPGLHLEESLRQVRCEVYDTTRGQQIPWSSSTFIGTFVAVPGPVRGPDVCAPAPAQAGRATVGSTRAFAALPAAIPIPRDRPRGQVRVTRERLVQLPPEQAYEEVIEDGSVGAYETFVQVYPGDPRTAYFRERVRARQESDVWLEVVEENSPQAYTRYLQRFPYGSYRNQAVVRIERFGGRVPDLPPPPRDYYEEAARPRATIVGPGVIAPPPRQVFVPGAPASSGPAQSAPAALPTTGPAGRQGPQVQPGIQVAPGGALPPAAERTPLSPAPSGSATLPGAAVPPVKDRAPTATDRAASPQPLPAPVPPSATAPPGTERAAPARPGAVQPGAADRALPAKPLPAPASIPPATDRTGPAAASTTPAQPPSKVAPIAPAPHADTPPGAEKAVPATRAGSPQPTPAPAGAAPKLPTAASPPAAAPGAAVPHSAPVAPATKAEPRTAPGPIPTEPRAVAPLPRAPQPADAGSAGDLPKQPRAVPAQSPPPSGEKTQGAGGLPAGHAGPPGALPQGGAPTAERPLRPKRPDEPGTASDTDQVPAKRPGAGGRP